MTALDDEPECQLAPSTEPDGEAVAWELRILLVAAVWLLPGGLFGLLARLGTPDGGPATLWLIGGGAIGALLGGLLEADSGTSSSDI